MRRKTAFMQWIDGQLAADPKLASDVEALLAEMKIEQEIVALREKRGLSQRQFARLLGTSQPYIAKLESGRIKNLGVRTLVKCASALGGRVFLRIEMGSVSPKRASQRPTRRVA
ncbi:MAG: helix-turn-helix domain-containing protein [Acidobacteriota bacterium]